jgi:hypothetical protein
MIMTIYAAAGDLVDILGSIPDNADRLLIRASRDIDQALLCAVYDDTDTDVLEVLAEATVEQVAGMIAAGDERGTGGAPPSSFSIGGLSVTRSTDPQNTGKINGLYRQAWLVLQHAGLTGYSPEDS